MLPVDECPNRNESLLSAEQVSNLWNQSRPNASVFTELAAIISIRRRSFITSAVPYWRDGKWILIVTNTTDIPTTQVNIMFGLAAIYLHRLNGGYITNTHHDDVRAAIRCFSDELALLITPKLMITLLAAIDEQRDPPAAH